MLCSMLYLLKFIPPGRLWSAAALNIGYAMPTITKLGMVLMTSGCRGRLTAPRSLDPYSPSALLLETPLTS